MSQPESVIGYVHSGPPTAEPSSFTTTASYDFAADLSDSDLLGMLSKRLIDKKATHEARADISKKYKRMVAETERLERGLANCVAMHEEAKHRCKLMLIEKRQLEEQLNKLRLQNKSLVGMDQQYAMLLAVTVLMRRYGTRTNDHIELDVHDSDWTTFHGASFRVETNPRDNSVKVILKEPMA